VLATLSLYFHTHTFASSVLPYAENSFKEPLPPVRHAALGVSVFAYDVLVMPRAWVEAYHGKSMVFHRAHEHGGHFRELYGLWKQCAKLTVKQPRSTIRTRSSGICVTLRCVPRALSISCEIKETAPSTQSSSPFVPVGHLDAVAQLATICELRI
jgi:hypothetical protein